jgi:chaperonin GroES
MKMTEAVIHPLRDQVLCEKLDEEQITDGGIEIPEIARGGVPLHRVLAVGPGEFLQDGKIREPRVKPGDLVIVKGIAMQGVVVNLLMLTYPGHPGKRCLVAEKDIVAIVAEPGSVN